MSRRVLSLVLFAITMLAAACSFAQETADDEAVIQRFTMVLERNPRRGTAFDKVYGYHADQGTLEELVNTYRSKAEVLGGQQAAAAWMIVGLVESRLGRDADAIRAFTQAEALDATNAMASYHLGQLLVLGGEIDQAAEAFERAIERKPAAQDLLDLFQALGRTYQRAQRNDKALEVWSRLEQQFPNNPRVQEQIAAILLEESDFVAALPRFEALVKTTNDKYRQSQFRVEVAEIRVRLGKTDAGLKDFEAVLGELNPQSWLYRDVRNRIESVFVKANDQAGLVKYYEAWIARHSDDIDAMTRLSRLYAAAGRPADSQKWLQSGLTLAPSNKELRLALAGQLIVEQKFHEAARQYEQMDVHDPNNPDIIHEWGRIILKDGTRELSARKTAAAAVWRKLITARPMDAHLMIQVADLFRRAEMTDEALELHRDAIRLDPEAAQYREYLGEYLHSLKRTDEALATWREIAAGARRTAPNLARLAEILAQHDQLNEAIESNAQACRLDPKDFQLQVKQADLLSKADKHAESLQQLAVVQKLVSNEEEREKYLQRELSELNSLNQLLPRIAEVRQNLAKAAVPDDPHNDWYWLARACDAAGLSREADEAISKAREQNPQSLPVLVTAARLSEHHRNLRSAVAIYKQLLVLNRKLRTDYLRRICVLEERLGNRHESLQAGRDLLAASPNNSEASDFVAQLCFRLGKADEGIQILRRSLRSNPGDLATSMKLAAALATRNQSAEAIELLWQAFDRSRGLEDRLALVQQLSETYSKLGQLNVLMARLERIAQDPAQERDLTICLAQVYETAKDFANALRKLETLWTEETRDTDLLSHLRRLAEQQNDLPAAIRYQRRVWEVTTQNSDRYQLALLLLKSGETDEATDLLTADTDGRELTGDVLKLLDELLNHGKPEALARINQLRRRFPEDWELLYREAVAQTKSGSIPIAIERFKKLVSLPLPEDEPSLLHSSATMPANRFVLFEQLSAATSIQQQATMIQARSAPRPMIGSLSFVGGQARQPVWIPREFGECRIAAWAWLVRLSAEPRDKSMMPIADDESREQLINRIISNSLLGNVHGKNEAARRLMRLSKEDPEAKAIFLRTIGERNAWLHVQDQSGQLQRQQSTLPRLSDDDCDEAIDIYRQVFECPELADHKIALLQGLVRELALAHREKRASDLIAEAADRVSTPNQVLSLLHLTEIRLKLEQVTALMDKLQAALNQAGGGQAGSTAIPGTNSAVIVEQVAGPLIAAVGGGPETAEVLTAAWRSYLRLLVREMSQPVSISPSRNAPGAMIVTQINGRIVRVIGQPDANEVMLHALIHFHANTFLALEGIRRNMAAQPRPDLIAHFAAEAEARKDSPEEHLLWQHSLAYLLWKDDQQSRALQILEGVVKQFPNRKRLRIGLARQYALAHQAEAALTVLEGAGVDTSPEQAEIDTLLLAYAAEAGLPDRVRTVSQRIARDHAINPQEASQISRQMIELKLYEEAEEYLLRANLSGGPLAIVIDVRTSFMEVLLLRGKSEQAASLAQKILGMTEKSTPVGTTVQIPGAAATFRPGAAVPFQARTQSGSDFSSHRLRCYKVLSETGQLEKMIESAEQEFKANPDSPALSNRLSGLYTAAGNHEKLDELHVLMLKKHVDKPEIRYALVLKYLEAGKSDDSLEQMKILLERNAEFFVARCSDTLKRYDGRPELVGFARLLVRLDWAPKENNEKQRLALHLSLLPTLIDRLWSRQPTQDVADELFLKVWNAVPDHRVLLLQRFRNDHWWSLNVVRDELRTLVSRQADSGSDFKVFGRVLGAGEAGRTTVWTRILDLAAAEMRLDDLASEVEKGLQQFPDWLAGAAMLGSIDLRRGNLEAGRDRLDKLFPELQAGLAANPTMAWEIGQELVRYDKCLDVGEKYYRVAIQQDGRADWMSVASSAGALINAYVALGRQADARKLLRSSVPAALRMDADPPLVPTRTDLVQALSIARRLRSLDYPLDAVEVYMAALDRSVGLQISGYNPRTEVESSFVVAFSEVKPEVLVEYLEDLQTQGRMLNLHLFVRSTDPGQGRMYSRWGSLLGEVSRNPSLAERVRVALDRTTTTEPDRIEPLLVSALLAMSARDESRRTAMVEKLVKFIEDHPLEKDSTSMKPIPMDWIGLWLIARECLTQPAMAASGDKLGQQALQSARVMRMPEFERAILTEWIRIAAASNQQETVDRLTNELGQIKP
ncbi:MAG: tetratricopeptide repeat protein [Planctomycetes bacterium]|nr:tetratricopeptide repeat protein [Planctomycetota bacterium]